MNEYTVEPAAMGDLEKITEIFAAARAFMAEQGNPQWSDGFPDGAFLSKKIADGNMYKLTCGGCIAAAFSVLEHDEEYERIDGAWLTDGNYFAVQTIAVSPSFRGKGCARYIFSATQTMASKRQKVSIRMSTHEKNIPMRTLVQSLGFTCCGTINVGGNQPRIAYEKLI